MSTDLDARLRTVAAALDDAADRYEISRGPVLERPTPRRRPVVLVALGVAAIAALVAAAVLTRTDARVRTTDPAVPSGLEVTPPPAGVETAFTVAEVEQVVLDQIRRDEDRVGTALTPARVTSITYFPGTEATLGQWDVEFEGTYVEAACGSYCNVSPGGQVRLTDGITTPRQALLDPPVCYWTTVDDFSMPLPWPEC